MKIILNSGSFNFGQASKAVSIARELSKLADVDFLCLGSGCAIEFMRRERIGKEYYDLADLVAVDRDGIIREIKDGSLQIFHGVDCVISVMDPVVASYFSTYVPTFYVNSLSFFFKESEVNRCPNLLNCRKYYFQELPGAFSSSKFINFPNSHPVPAIVNVDDSKPISENGPIIATLGGLNSPLLNREAVAKYMDNVMSLLDAVGAEDAVIVAGEVAAQQLSKKWPRINTLSHTEMIEALRNAKRVFAAPGLTTMLELTALAKPCAPLPPAMITQALNLINIADMFGHVENPWTLLADRYKRSIDYLEKIPESANKIHDLDAHVPVQKMLEKTASHLLSCGNLLDSFATFMSSPHSSTLPSITDNGKDGAHFIAKDIINHIHN